MSLSLYFSLYLFCHCYFVCVFVFVFVFWVVRTCLLITLIACLKGHKSLLKLGELGEGNGDGENFKIESFLEHEMTLGQHV